MAFSKIRLNGTTLMDVTDATSSATEIMSGYTAYGADGQKITGVAVIPEQSNDFVITLSYNSTTEMWEPDCMLSEYNTAITSGKNIAIKCDDNTRCFIADDMSENYLMYAVEPENVVWSPFLHGEFITKYYTWDLSGLSEEVSDTVSYSSFNATATAADIVSGKTAIIATGAIVGTYTPSVPSLQSKTATPTESSQTITADSGYDGLSSVEVGAVSNTYVGSGIDQRDSTDLTVSGATVSAPAGYYAAAASKSVASGSEGTPTASKGTVSNHSISITPSVTNTEGYISGGTYTGTAVSVAVSELVSGTLTIDSSGTKDVTNYASVSVPVGSEGTPTATKGTVSNHSVSVTPSVTNTAGYISGGTNTGAAVSVSASELVSGTKSITANGTGIDVTDYAEVDVAIPFQTIYSGSSDPAAATGSNGDIYIKVVS